MNGRGRKISQNDRRAKTMSVRHGCSRHQHRGHRKNAPEDASVNWSSRPMDPNVQSQIPRNEQNHGSLGYEEDVEESLRNSVYGRRMLQDLQMPKVRQKTVGFKDQIVSMIPLQPQLSSTVKFVAWTGFHESAKRCANEWRTTIPCLEDAVVADETECFFKSVVQVFQVSRFDWKHDIMAHVQFTLRSLLGVEPLLGMISDHRTSQTSIVGEKNARLVATEYWELLTGSTSHISEADGNIFPKPSEIEPDFGFAIRSRQGSASSGVNIEVKGPHKSLVHEDEERTLRSAEDVAKSHNDFFRKPQYSDSGSLKNPWYFHMMSQAIVSALHTSSGFAALYTHNQAVFMRVSIPSLLISKKQKHVRLQVEISKIYECSGAVTACHGILAILQAARDAGREDQNELRKALYVLSVMKNDELKTTGMTSSMVKNATEPGSDSGAQGQEGEAKDGRSKNRRNAGYGTGIGPTPRFRIVSKESKGSRHEENNVRRRKGKYTFEAGRSEGHVLVKRNSVGTRKEHWLFREGSPFERSALIDKVIRNHEGIVGEGASGFVARSSVDGLTVAVKYWNMRDEEGRQWFINELDINEYLLETAPSLFGDVLPRIVAIRRLEPFDSALVTELVGLKLKYVNGKMLVGDIPVEGEEAEKLYEAGLIAIRRLHAAGVVHRDIASDNLRVARDFGKTGALMWRVWILDLGQATKTYDEWEEEWDLKSIRACLAPGIETCRIACI